MELLRDTSEGRRSLSAQKPRLLSEEGIAPSSSHEGRELLADAITEALIGMLLSEVRRNTHPRRNLPAHEYGLSDASSPAWLPAVSYGGSLFAGAGVGAFSPLQELSSIVNDGTNLSDTGGDPH